MKLSEQSKELLNRSWELRNALKQVVPAELVEYLLQLIAKDLAHRKLWDEKE